MSKGQRPRLLLKTRRNVRIWAWARLFPKSWALSGIKARDLGRISRLSPSTTWMTLWVPAEMSSSQQRKRSIRYNLRAMLWKMTKRLYIRTAHRCFPNLANATGQVSASISNLTRENTHTRIISVRVTDKKWETSIEVLNVSAKYVLCMSMRLKVVIHKTNKQTISKISHCQWIKLQVSHLDW